MDIDIAIWLLVIAGLISDMADMADIASVRAAWISAISVISVISALVLPVAADIAEGVGWTSDTAPAK